VKEVAVFKFWDFFEGEEFEWGRSKAPGFVLSAGEIARHGRDD
jgi:hypothetical protein